VVRTYETGLDGVNFVSASPGAPYGEGIFVLSVGIAPNADGGLYIMDREGEITPFLTQSDAVSAVYDTGTFSAEDCSSPTSMTRKVQERSGL
jgi:hypothetical protein